jgi:hypothetical protein
MLKGAAQVTEPRLELGEYLILTWFKHTVFAPQLTFFQRYYTRPLWSFFKTVEIVNSVIWNATNSPLFSVLCVESFVSHTTSFSHCYLLTFPRKNNDITSSTENIHRNILERKEFYLIYGKSLLDGMTRSSKWHLSCWINSTSPCKGGYELQN